MPVPGPLQTVQRAEFWGAIVALQSYWPCHLGIDNLHVARSIGRLLDDGCLAKRLPLIKDGDLVGIAQNLILTRGRDTVGVTEVKGDATDSDVELGRVRLEDRLGNAEADALLLIWVGVINLSCSLMLGVSCSVLVSRWCPTKLQLHRFMIAVSRVAVNHDGRGGSAPDPLVRDQGRRLKQRRVDIHC